MHSRQLGTREKRCRHIMTLEVEEFRGPSCFERGITNQETSFRTVTLDYNDGDDYDDTEGIAELTTKPEVTEGTNYFTQQYN